MMRLSRYGGNPNIAVYAAACESLALTAADASPEFVRDLEEALGVEVVKTTVGGSYVVGSLAVMNSHGAIVTDMADDGEVALIEARLGCARVVSKLNAFGNNVLANDYGAIVSPEYSEAAAAEIGDALGVEAVRASIGGIATVGSVCRATNKGCVCHMDASDEEVALILDVLKVEAVRTTANHGVRAVGAGVLANSKGAVVGDETTPIEMGRIEEGLVLYRRRLVKTQHSFISGRSSGIRSISLPM